MRQWHSELHELQTARTIERRGTGPLAGQPRAEAWGDQREIFSSASHTSPAWHARRVARGGAAAERPRASRRPADRDWSAARRSLQRRSVARAGRTYRRLAAWPTILALEPSTLISIYLARGWVSYVFVRPQKGFHPASVRLLPRH